MVIYKGELMNDTISLFHQIFPVMLCQHFSNIIESAPTARFYAHIVEDQPNLIVYLVEYNQQEKYTLCHLFLTDHLGQDYDYQGMSIEHVNFFEQIAKQHFPQA
ncbi:hypothetical protein [Paenibacillus fonticola]|uniref:hypothetical protein n=1 Tax=Paenibacillus fonticola TaxID=379896 RepID=UPI000371BE53|nr:hypothetical protein [Paenibacillus fonticola]